MNEPPRLAASVAPDGTITIIRGTPLRRERVKAEEITTPVAMADLLTRIQDNSAAAFEAITSIPFLPTGGVLLSAVTGSVGQTAKLSHRLGRAFRGFIELNPASGPPRFVRAATQEDSSKWIQLTAGANGVADIWVY